MTASKKIMVDTLTVMLAAILFPPWGWATDPYQNRSFGFLFSGPFRPDYPLVSHVINWQLLGAELLAISVVGAILLIISKK